jgi:hypothetical protein
MKMFFAVHGESCCSRRLLPVVRITLLGVLGVMLSMPQTIVCWPRISNVPGLPLIQRTCESAEKTVPPLVLRGLATIIEKSNEHKMLGGVVVGLAAVGAGYLLTRPYVWANGQTALQRQRTEEAERKVIEAQLTTVIVEKELLQTQYDHLAQDKNRVQLLLDYERDIAKMNREADEFVLKSSKYPYPTGKLMSELNDRIDLLDGHLDLVEERVVSQEIPLKRRLFYIDSILQKLGIIDNKGAQVATDVEVQNILDHFVNGAQRSNISNEKSMIASQSLTHISTAPSAMQSSNYVLERTSSEESVHEDRESEESVVVHEDKESDDAELVK